jgi:hypothetical protein
MQIGDQEGAALEMTRFLELTRSGWLGDGEAIDVAVLNWFMGCFPIRSEPVRADLRRQLERALAERAKRRLK